MLTAYERRLMLGYLSNVASRLNHRSPQAEALHLWLSEHGGLLGLTHAITRPIDAKRRKRSGRNPSVEEWQAVRDGLSSALDPIRRARPDRTSRRVRRVACEVGLSKSDAGIIELVLRYNTHPQMESMVDDFLQFFRSRRGYGLSVRHDGMAELLGLLTNFDMDKRDWT